MKKSLLAVVAVTVALVAGLSRAQDMDDLFARKLCDLQDPRINESSGLAASQRYAKQELLWTHNDSGGEPRIFGINLRGETVADVVLQGAKNLDWEDIAVAGQWIYVADCGDNRENRPNFTVYRIPEPELDPLKTGQVIETPAESVNFTYPDRARNCETILAMRDGTLLFVSKNGGNSKIYKAPKPYKSGEDQTLEYVGQYAFSDGGERPNPFSMLTTGGSVASDEKHLVIRTYTRAYEWAIPEGNDWKALWANPPRIFQLPPARQGESICYAASGRRFFATSEQLPAPLFLIEDEE